jgi:nitrate/nitrite transporter NarK
MLIIEGVPAIVWAFVFAALTADRPADAPWLPGSEREALTAALREEQQHLPEMSGYLHALRSRTVLVLSVQYLLWSVGVYGFVFWLPTIVKAGAGVGIAATGLLSAVPYLLAVVLMIVVSHRSDATGRRRVFVWPFLLVAALAFYGSYLLGTGAFWPAFGLLVLAGGCMYAPYGPYFALIPELVPQNVAGASMALVNSFGALGAFVGAYVVGWLNGAVGSGAAFVFMAAAVLVAAGLMLAVPDTRMHATAQRAVTPWLGPSHRPRRV